MLVKPMRNWQLEIGNVLAEGTGLEPASDKCAVVFGTTALPVRLPFQNIFDCQLAIAD